MATKKSSKKKDISEIRLGKGSIAPKPNNSMSDRTIKTWIKVHRAMYAAGTLSTYKIARLEEIPGWIWK